MKSINKDASDKEIIEAISNLIASHNAFKDMLENLAISRNFNETNRNIAALEKKLIVQGDLIVSYADKINKLELHCKIDKSAIK